MDENTDRELEVLENIYNNGTHVRQRDLASVLGLSLGMTNAIIKRLGQKGWLTIRKVNNRNIRYAVSPAGAEEITRRSYRYFRRTIKNVVDYKETIGRVVSVARDGGYTKLVLVGNSDLDFVIEHVCGKQAMEFATGPKGDSDTHTFYLHSERVRSKKTVSASSGEAYLRKILM